MELGISPIISASWIIQIFTACGIFKVTTPKEERILMGFEKTFAMVLCLGEAVGQVWYGAYGLPATLGFTRIFLIVLQLMVAGFVVILIDDVLRSGYGLGSGISLFIVANTSENIFWHMFSPVTLTSEYGIEFEGAFVCLIHFLLTKPNKWSAVIQAFTRTSSPNLSSFCGTLLIFFIVIYLQGFIVKIPLIHQRHRGYKTVFPVRLFFTSNISVILQSMFVSNFYVLSMLLFERFSKTYLVNFLGVW